MKKNTKKNDQMYYLYDREADVFYLSQGKPSSRDRVIESDDDVLLRADTAGKVRGFTIMNFSKHEGHGKSLPIKLPLRGHWVTA